MKTLLILSSLAFTATLQATELFHSKEVRLLDGVFKQSLDLNESYLLAHDPDRFLAPFLTSAGLEPKAEKYGNWESSGLDGHSAGHYLSALALSYTATGKIEYKQRLDYMLDELARCQNTNGNGYLGGVPNGNEAWRKLANGEIEVERFSMNGAWVPWYNLHKTFAGLKDAWLVAESEKAKKILLELCDWCVEITQALSDEQMQKMLYAEHGGMNEIFAHVYQLTGKKEYMETAKRFSHKELLAPLIAGEDSLTGKHANTQIPKAIGFQRIAMTSDSPTFGHAAEQFWNNVVEQRTIVFGGNSVREHFHPTDDFRPMFESREGPESCNTHNLLRLTTLLYQDSQDERYLDYYERALFNHILSLQHPTTGGFVYFTPIRPQHYRVYSQPEKAFWCCVGSGMENPGRYTELIYAKDVNTLFVNLFIASEVYWAEKEIRLRQKTNFPHSDKSEITVFTDRNKFFDIAVRIPAWTKEDYSIQVNGEAVPATTLSNGYSRISRNWKNGDRIEISTSMSIRSEQLPDGSNYHAFLYGPIALAARYDDENLEGLFAGSGRMEHIAPGPYFPLDKVPVLIGTDEGLSSRVSKIPDQEMKFALGGDMAPQSQVTLEPFYQIHEARYTLYWQVASKEEYANMIKALEIEERNRAEIVSRTIDSVFPGEQQSEVEHDFFSEDSFTDALLGKQFRASSQSFEYTVKSVPADSEIVLTFFGSEWGRACDVFVNDTLVGEILGKGQYPEKFIEAVFAIPEEVKSLKADEIQLKISAKNNQLTPSIFEIAHRVKAPR